MSDIREEVENLPNEIEDLEEDAKEEKSTYDKIVDWARDNKGLAIAGAVGTVVISALVGGKIFSKTNVVEKQIMPDPTIMDKYDRVPVKESSYIDYQYVLKPEYRDLND